MNPILASAESSAVISTIRESKQVNPWVYNEAERLTTPHSLQLLNVPVSSGSVQANRTFTMELPKNGQLQQVWLKFTMPAFDLTNGDDDEVDEDGAPEASNVEGFNRIGLLAMIDEIKLESSGRVHEQLSTFQILQRLSDLPLAQRTAAQRSYRMGGDPRDNEGYTASLLLPFFWYKDGPRYGIDTDFQEPMRIVVKLNACTTIFDLSSTGYVAHVPTDCEAICEYRQWDDATKQQVISSNYGGGMLSRVVRLSAEEALNTHTPGAAASATTTIDLKESDVVTGFYVVVECPDTGSVATYANAIKQGSPLECTNFELKFAGQSILNVPGEFLQYYGRDYGRPSTHGAGDNGVVDKDDNSNIQYVYKISFDAMGTALGNAVALREISRAQLIVTYKPAAASVLHNIHIGYEKVSFLTVASSTGRTNLSISS